MSSCKLTWPVENRGAVSLVNRSTLLLAHHIVDELMLKFPRYKDLYLIVVDNIGQFDSQKEQNYA